MLELDEIAKLFSKIDNKITTIDDVVRFIKSKKEPKDDETVYLSETDRADLSFEDIKKWALGKLAN